MARRNQDEEVDVVLPPPATTLEGREDQLVAMAYDAIEMRIAKGQASSQELVHFAKQGSRHHQLELQKLQSENEVLKSRVKEMEARKSQEEMLEKALNAFKGYAGQGPTLEEMEGDYYEPDVY